MKKIFLTALFLMAASAFASGAAGADPHAIPWRTVSIQAFNFLILVAGLAYVLRQPVKEHFAVRLKTYSDLVRRADDAKAEAEKSHREISERIRKLQATADQSIVEARNEAEAIKTRLIAEAKAVSLRIEEESKRSIELEFEKAKVALRKELLSRALEASKEYFQKNLGTTEQKRLQTEFVEKIQVVRG